MFTRMPKVEDFSFNWEIKYGNLIIYSPRYTAFIPLWYLKEAIITVSTGEEKKKETTVKISFRSPNFRGSHQYIFKQTEVTREKLVEMVMDVRKECL